MIDQIIPMLPVYVPAMILATAGLAWLWFRGPDGAPAVEPFLVVGLPLIVGFCALERRWPWELQGPWRTHYWVPVGLLLLSLGGGALYWRRFPGLVVLLLAGLGLLYAMLDGYAMKLNSEWSATRHGWLLAALLCLALTQSIGQGGLARLLPGWAYFLGLGCLFLGGTVYSLVGASSLKVAQWMTIGGALAMAGCVLGWLHRTGAWDGHRAFCGPGFSPLCSSTGCMRRSRLRSRPCSSCWVALGEGFPSLLGGSVGSPRARR